MSRRAKVARSSLAVEAPFSALLWFAGALLASSLLLTGCNTAEGIGDDAEEAGEELGDAFD